MLSFAEKGIYTVSDAARLLSLKPPTIRRWGFGYERRRKRYDPAIKNELPVIAGTRALSFLELVELLYIKGLLQSGHSWKRVREAAKVAAREMQVDHPFATRRFFADPGAIYTLVSPKNREPILIELAGHGQIAMREVLRTYLHQLDFSLDDVNEIAVRWYPVGREAPIVVDPILAFGAPTIRGTGIRTDLLAEHVGSDDEEAIDDVAWWFELEPWKVKAAVEFERGMDTA